MNLMPEDYPAADSAAAEDQLYTFLAAVAQVDAILLRHQQQYQFDPHSDFYPPSSELENATRAMPYWAGRSANWQSNIPQFDLPAESRMAQLVDQYQLSEFELAVLLLGCLNSFEPRYRQLFAQLPLQQNEGPSFGLVQALFCPGTFLRHAQRASLQADAPLQRDGLIELLPRRNAGEEQGYRTHEMVLDWLLGSESLPAALQGIARWVEDKHNDRSHQAAVSQLAFHQSLTPLLDIRSEAGTDREAYIAELARHFNSQALLVSWLQLLNAGRDAPLLLRQLFNFTRLTRSLLVLDLPPPKTAGEGGDSYSALVEQLEQIVEQQVRDGLPLPICTLSAAQLSQLPFSRLSRHALEISVPGLEDRYNYLLSLLGGNAPQWDARALVQRIALPFDTMRSAVAESHALAMQRGKMWPQEEDFRAAFLRRARQNFNALAQRITPQRNWDDIIISSGLREQLDEVLCAVRQRERVLERGFARKVGKATGISALFYGDPGTGKSMVAEVMAGALGVDLIRVDLSSIINKYIGETEKNLARVFDLAEQDAGVLFFDEADALFGKRSETKDAKDRHANIEVAYLLQRLEHHPGLVILATNNRSHLDDAFTRRFSFITHFAYPNAELREKMWRAVWPPQIKVAKEVDFARLAQLALTGANIRNAALLASWLSAEKKTISLEHIERAIQRELSKMGRG
ncbi:ATP-binding protein [Pantoea sp. A4]|uniref:ATP-binding protein n=1 Tax=Pantoea sp. A4 TaxID=1225184 RepID=UPI00036F43EE|nr:AAA family ATPase [Pantoea sp. A4]